MFLFFAIQNKHIYSFCVKEYLLASNGQHKLVNFIARLIFFIVIHRYTNSNFTVSEPRLVLFFYNSNLYWVTGQ